MSVNNNTTQADFLTMLTMQLNDYIPLAIRTESPRELGLPARQTRLLHAAVGVATELSEFIQATEPVNEAEELGDSCWYLAIATDALGAGSIAISTGGRANRVRRKELVHELHVRSGEFLDLMKKWAFYGKEPSEVTLTMTVFNLWQSVANLSAASGHEFGDVLATNIKKLKVRYPERFTEDAAVNRDLPAERAALTP